MLVIVIECGSGACGLYWLRGSLSFEPAQLDTNQTKTQAFYSTQLIDESGLRDKLELNSRFILTKKIAQT